MARVYRERPAYAPIDEEHPAWPEFSEKRLAIVRARCLLGYEPGFTWRTL